MPVPKSRAGQPATAGGFTHDVEVDKTGIAWVTGEDGTFGFRPGGDPLKPELLYRSDENVTNSGNSGPSSPETANDYPLDFLHHNSKRTGGGRGSVMAITEEDYTRPGCQGQGSLQTWKITGEKNSDGTAKLKLLDLWTTELNELSSFSGRSPATVNCSAHWFDEQGGLVAQGWYDQGVRFLDISKPKDIRQVGYWATTGTFWAAYFAPTDKKHEVVYGLDTAGGIDVLRIDRSKRKAPTVRAPRETLVKLDPASGKRYRPSQTFGMACVLPGQGLVQRQ